MGPGVSEGHRPHPQALPLRNRTPTRITAPAGAQGSGTLASRTPTSTCAPHCHRPRLHSDPKPCGPAPKESQLGTAGTRHHLWKKGQETSTSRYTSVCVLTPQGGRRGAPAESRVRGAVRAGAPAFLPGCAPLTPRTRQASAQTARAAPGAAPCSPSWRRTQSRHCRPSRSG